MPMVRAQQTLWLLFVGGSLNLLLATAATSAPLTPESPEVKAAIQRGVKWLEGAQDPRVGAKALIGLALVKNGSLPTHPKVVEAVQAIRKMNQTTSDPRKIPNPVYTVGLSIIFLTALDTSEYQADIGKLLQALQTLQKKHGGWGYPHLGTGDTSMTQYGTLALWEANQSGIRVSQAMAENALDWLLLTQDPSGAFGYQGKVASNPTELVEQPDIRPSLATAGVGSVYVCADLLGLVKKKSDLPQALKEVTREKARQTIRISMAHVEAAKNRGNEWMQRNYYRDPGLVRYPHYYLYALERYWSFREAAEGISPDQPAWYDDAAAYLLQTQTSDGGWFGEWGSVPDQASVPDTCFSLLFLLRSMKKSIEQDRNYGRGLLVGGRGLPRGATVVQLRGGQVVARPLAGPAQGLMAALENVDSAEYDQAIEALAELPANEARQLVSQNEAKLRELVDGDSSETRLAAVQALAKSDDLEAVPTLIYAMSDPDPAVVLAADEGLRRMSRRFQGVGLPDDFTETQRADAIRQWKDWYLDLRPDAEFEN